MSFFSRFFVSVNGQSLLEMGDNRQNASVGKMVALAIMLGEIKLSGAKRRLARSASLPLSSSQASRKGDPVDCSIQDYKLGPAATKALPASLPSYLAKFLMKRLAKSLAFSSH